MTSFARRERDQLCDLALELGAGAPTLCDGWDVKDLVVHLLVRERSLLGAPGIVLSPLSGLTARASERTARADLALLVDQLRRPRLTWAALGPVDRLANSVEFFVHHEDVRRAQHGWVPRSLGSNDEATLWSTLKVTGRGLARAAGVPLEVRNAVTGQVATLVKGQDPVRVSGDPSELVLFLYGRDQVHGVEFEGPQDAVRRASEASYGM